MESVTKKTMVINWKCNECKKEFTHPLTMWLRDHAFKVAVGDWFCPHCNGYEVVYQGPGTEDEYWISRLNEPE